MRVKIIIYAFGFLAMPTNDTLVLFCVVFLCFYVFVLGPMGRGR